MAINLKIYSDYVCPYCLLFKLVLEEATKDLNIKVDWKAVELRPYPNPTLRPEDDYLPDVWASSVYPLAKKLNIQIRLPTVSPQPYSRLAHEGYRFAELAGLADQYNDEVFRAFFQRDSDIGDLEILINIANKVGLNKKAFRAALESEEFTSAHNKSLSKATERGVFSVPNVWVNDRILPVTYEAENLRLLLLAYDEG
ncbi:MAG: DsbA family protein [Pseudomonadota bacterium]|nr:DsbA family protein [Pseudomonadota bacterium]